MLTGNCDSIECHDTTDEQHGQCGMRSLSAPDAQQCLPQASSTRLMGLDIVCSSVVIGVAARFRPTW